MQRGKYRLGISRFKNPWILNLQRRIPPGPLKPDCSWTLVRSGGFFQDPERPHVTHTPSLTPQHSEINSLSGSLFSLGKKHTWSSWGEESGSDPQKGGVWLNKSLLWNVLFYKKARMMRGPMMQVTSSFVLILCKPIFVKLSIPFLSSFCSKTALLPKSLLIKNKPPGLCCMCSHVHVASTWELHVVTFSKVLGAIVLWSLHHCCCHYCQQCPSHCFSRISYSCAWPCVCVSCVSFSAKEV